MYGAHATDADLDARNTFRCFSVGALARTEDSSVTVFHLLDCECSDLSIHAEQAAPPEPLGAGLKPSPHSFPAC